MSAVEIATGPRQDNGARPGLATAGTITRRGRFSTVEMLAVGLTAATFAAQPALHPTGPGNSSPVDLLVFGSLIAVAMWATTARLRLRAPYSFAAALIVLAGALAGLNGPLPGASLSAVVQDVVLIAWCTSVVAVASSPGRLRLLARAWAYSAVTYAVILVTAWFLHIGAITGIVAREGNRVLFTFGDPNYAATYWVLSIFVVYAAGVPRRGWLRFAAFTVLLGALALTESNGGAVELTAGTFFLVLLGVRRKWGTLVAATTLLFAAALFGLLLHTVSVSALQTWARQSGNSFLVNSVGRSNDSSAERSILNAESFQLYDTDGVLGSGPGTTKELLTNRAYAYAKEAHNDYLAALTERGPIGLLGILVLVTSAASRAARIVGRLPSNNDRDLPRPAGLAAAALAAAIAASYYEVLHFRFVWGLLALVAAAAYQADRRSGWPEPSAQEVHA